MYLYLFVFVFMCMCLYFVNIVFLSQFYLSQSSRFCHYLSQKNCYVPCITMIISFLHHNDYLSIFSNESCTYECSIFWRFLNLMIKSNLDTTLSLLEYLLSCLWKQFWNLPTKGWGVQKRWKEVLVDFLLSLTHFQAPSYVRLLFLHGKNFKTNRYSHLTKRNSDRHLFLVFGKQYFWIWWYKKPITVKGFWGQKEA